MPKEREPNQSTDDVIQNEHELNLSEQENQIIEKVYNQEELDYWNNEKEGLLYKFCGHSKDIAADIFTHNEEKDYREKVLRLSNFLWHHENGPPVEYNDESVSVLILYNLKLFDKAQERFDTLREMLKERKNLKYFHYFDALRNFGKIASVMNSDKDVSDTIQKIEKINDGSLDNDWKNRIIDTAGILKFTYVCRKEVLSEGKKALRENKEAYKHFDIKRCLELGIHPQELGLTDEDYKSCLIDVEK